MQPHNSLALQGQDRIPREYTNPDEVVTFDRNTPFQRAIDVINQFAQERLNKVIIDRTGTEGSIGISVPPMHWRDALDLLLRVKDLVLIEQDEIFEIVPYQEPAQDQGQTAQGGNVAVQAGQGQQGDGPVATIDSREVRINAIFFEGSRRALQEIGVDWSTLTENVPANLGNFVGQNQGGGGGGGGGQGGGGSGELPATSGFEDQFVSVNSKGAQNVSQNVFNALINFGQVGNSGIEVQALFSAFEADNLGEILASPSVKVMDRQEGRIQVGQDFSIKQRDFAGNVTDQFFSVGTILTVTPTIIEENDTTVIHLDIQAERSSAQPDPVSTIVNKQTAETQAILVDGEATAIAGLYRSEVAEVRRGVPILKDLPPWLFGLRYLFGFNSKDYQMRELVILVQAEIEPTIAERYGRENANKFDVLHEERERIRNEIERKDQYSPTRMEQLNADDEDEAEGSETELPEETIPEQEEQNSQEEEEMPGQQSREEETDEYLDPEMEAKPVPLNLGTEQENKNEEQSEAGESPVDGDGAETSRAEAVEPEPAADSTDEIAEPEGEQDTRLDPQGGSAGNYNYFIVAASFLNRENAVEFQQELREQGYDAVVVEDPDSSYHFVAYSGHQTLEEAKAELNTIWERHNADAWIFNAR
ncbi:SPOR domain-containing protein [Halalkalibaculum sp. DA384]|uniref:SPOR domain-containing protein n=1 Tax=Halalkalibaculum sp. DA384 TaxID=3373606 RepID=UPI003754C151